MKKRNQRFLSLLLALLMVVSLLPAAALAAVRDEDPVPLAPPAAEEDGKTTSATPAVVEEVPAVQDDAPAELAAVTNIALGKSTSASSDTDGDFPSSRAVDGDAGESSTSYWATAWGHTSLPSWLQIDLGLGATATVDNMVIKFRNDQYSNDYTIATSATAADNSWTTVYTLSNRSGAANNQEDTIGSSSLLQNTLQRYVRITFTTMHEPTKSLSVLEWRINGELTGNAPTPTGTPDGNLCRPSDGVTVRAEASSTEADSVAARYAIDGDTTSSSSRWGSDVGNGPHSLTIDLGVQRSVSLVKIFWERRNVLAYTLEGSADNQNWSTLYTCSSEITTCNETLTFPSANIRYLKLNITSHRSTGLKPDGSESISWNTVSLFEVEIYRDASAILATPSSFLATLSAESFEVVTNGSAKTLQLKSDVEVPTGFTVTFAANLEQVVGADGTVYQPLVDAVVDLDVTVANGADAASTAPQSPIRVTIPGAHTAAENEGGNPKPAVIPEIMEWYSHGTNAGYKDQSYTLGDSVRILYRYAFADVAQELQADLKDLYGVNAELKRLSGSFTTLQTPGTLESGDIVLFDVDPANSSEDSRNRVQGYDDETYGMEIYGGKVYIYATHATGAYWGTRTLLQGMKLSEDGRSFPNGTLRDYPEFKVRGFVLDVGRKPISMDMLQSIVKNMAWYKLNDFHVHLNDNLIQIEEYGYTSNDCTQAQYDEGNRAYAAFRLESSLQEEEGANPLAARDYHYTKAEFKKLITDSATLGVTIVPEIDVPAHAKAITDAWPSLREPKNFNRHALNDHFNLSGKFNESLAKAKEIFNDYIDDGTFCSGTVHFGADEYYPDNALYRRFHKAMIAYLKEKDVTIRTWGSLTQMSSSNPDVQYTREETAGVQMNIWNTGWANPTAMYNLGFDLINVTDGPFYMVPDGGGGRGGYGDYLNLTDIYNKAPNNIGGTWFPASSSQILGESYAIWGDSMLESHSTGMNEVDVFDRFFDTLPVIAVRQWGVKNNTPARTLADLQADAAITGTAPRTNPYYRTDETDFFTYDFADNTDKSGNGHDLTLTNAEINSSKSLLVLKGGASYAETGLDRLGWGNRLSFRALKLTASDEEEILFEGDHAYGDFSIKALPVEGKDNVWKLGFSRELHDYEFNVELPVGEWVSITLTNDQQSTKLSVNGGAAVAAVGQLVAKPDSNTQFQGKTGITNSSFELPVARIGSKHNAFRGYLAAVTTGEVVQSPLADNKYDIPTSKYTLTAGSEETTNHDDVEGPLSNAIDNNTNTYWHSNWDENLSATPDDRWIQIELDEATEVSFLRYQPRPTIANGIVIEYRVEVSTDGVNWETVSEGDWAHDTTAKLALFDSAVTAQYIRLYGVETRGAANDDPNKFMSCAEIRVCRPISLTGDGPAVVTFFQSSYSLEDGKAEPDPTVTLNGAVLTKGTDYTVTYTGNTAAGTATATVTGIGSYTGTLTANFEVTAPAEKADLSAATVTFAETSYPLENGKAEPAPTVKMGSTTLLQGLDYTVTYENNTAVGTATATITGMGDYTGEKTATFTVTPAIVKKDLSDTAKTKVILSQTTFPYDGVAITPEPVVTYDGETLVKGTHYTVSYARNNAVGTATVTVLGRAPYCTGSASATFTIVEPSKGNDLADVNKTVVTLRTTQYEYTGQPITPIPSSVRYNGVRLTQGTDYTVSYLNNINAGTGVLVITGTGDYYGSYFTIFTITGGAGDTPGSDPGNSSGGSSSGGGSGSSLPSVGPTTTEVTKGDGVTTIVKTDPFGAMLTQSTYDDGTKVIADIPVTGPVTAVVTVPNRVNTVTVTIPTRGEPTPGQVAVILHPDGTEEIVKTSLPTEGGVELTLDASATVQVVDNTKDFVDVPADSWAKNAIDFVTSREIFNGTGNGTFTPTGDMSRAMVCTVLANLAGEDTKGGATWYEKSVSWAKQSGISDGSTPNATVTREQLAAMLYRYAGSPTVSDEVPRRFRDRDAISDWAELAVTWAVQNDLIHGRGSGEGLDLAPQATATRAEVAAVLQRYVALLK